jgi:hypothetical protein
LENNEIFFEDGTKRGGVFSVWYRQDFFFLHLLQTEELKLIVDEVNKSRTVAVHFGCSYEEFFPCNLEWNLAFVLQCQHYQMLTKRHTRISRKAKKKEFIFAKKSKPK